MFNIPKLGYTVDRFNQGCSFFQRAISAWKDGNLPDYENSLRKAATEAIGALEWALKVYLRSICRDRISAEDRLKLKQLDFEDLMTLMQSYADPPMDPVRISLFYDYRELFRNAAEHDVSVPPSQELHAAIEHVRELILTYLPLSGNQLSSVAKSVTTDTTIQLLKEGYFDALRSQYEFMDLGGISPRVGSKVVKIRMEDLFIPLQASEEEPLLESFETELQEKSPESLNVPWLGISDVDRQVEETDGIDSSEIEPQEVTHRHRRKFTARSIEMKHILEKPMVVILGHPGSGKATIGKYVAYSIALGKWESIGEHLNGFIPVIIKAAEYAQLLRETPGLSVYDYTILKHTVKFGNLFSWALQNGSCMMVIDGLDEISDNQLRTMTTRRIERFVSEFVQNRFLVTSRIVGYRQNQLTGNFSHVTLDELDDDQILAFLEHWYKSIEDESGSQATEIDIKRRSKDLWEAVESNPGIQKLAGTPLLLTIIALANWRGTKLPSRRVELYQIATETLLENWPLKQRGLTLHSEEILAILGLIAHHIFSSGKNNLITEFELRPLFEAQVCEVRGTRLEEARTFSRELLQTIEEHTGFFLQRGLDQQGQSVYGFLHLTFAEYLTARVLAEQWSSEELDLAKYAHETLWHEVVLLMSGHIGTWAVAQATRLVRNILELGSEYENHLHRDLLLAAEVLGDNVRVKRELQDDVVSRLISLALTTSYLPLWEETVERLADIAKVFSLGNPEVQLQIQSQDDADTRVRKAVMLAMVGQDTDEILCTLLEALTEPKTRQRFVEPFLYSFKIFTDHGDPRTCWQPRPVGPVLA